MTAHMMPADELCTRILAGIAVALVIIMIIS
jgi:hypothetical protein